jgi:serine/threonine protein kinase
MSDRKPPLGVDAPGGSPRASAPPPLPTAATRTLHVTDYKLRHSRTYSFVVDDAGRPIEVGSGRFARVFLGEERRIESETELRLPVVIKMLAKSVAEDDAMRFRSEKQLLARVQGHPSIVALLGSGKTTDPGLPALIREQCEGDYMILEKLDMNLEERIKGSRNSAARENLLGLDMHDRLLRVLEYMIPIASAVEHAHLVCNVCHRDIKPSNVLVRLRDPKLAGSTLQVRLADFNVGKMQAPDGEPQMGMTRFSHAVPGTLYFESPEQEANLLELLVNVQQGSPEIEYFEDFYIDVGKNDGFALFNRTQEYSVLYNDRARKRLVLKTPYAEPSETNIRARVQKSVGRPADIYSLGALFYYLVTGAYGNPKALYDTLHKFVEFERPDETNNIEAYLRHEYQTIESLRSPKTPGSAADVAPADRFFTYKHYVDGNGELINIAVMQIVARCMVRNKPDSYCEAHDLATTGVSRMVRDLTNLYSLFGFQAGSVPAQLSPRTGIRGGVLGGRGASAGGAVKKLYGDALAALGLRKKP